MLIAWGVLYFGIKYYGTVEEQSGRLPRSPHQALDALAVGLERKKVNWVLDAAVFLFPRFSTEFWIEVVDCQRYLCITLLLKNR